MFKEMDISTLVVIPQPITNTYNIKQVFTNTPNGLVKIGYLVSLQNGKWGIELLDKTLITINPTEVDKLLSNNAYLI